MSRVGRTVIVLLIFAAFYLFINNSNRLIVRGNEKSDPVAVIEGSIEELIKQCMKVANVDHILAKSSNYSHSILQEAQENAKYLLEELQKVVPEDPLAEYGDNYCWKMNLAMQWTNEIYYTGQLGNFTFQSLKFTSLLKKRRYKSSFACLPNIFYGGFPKCGSTFFHCALKHTLSLLKNAPINTELHKEPRFWYDANPKGSIHIPKLNEFGDYLLNYLPGLESMSESNDNGIILSDGSPGMMVKWPRFRKSEHDLTNYCLAPAVLSKLLPNSKFIVLTRNQPDMLYSLFWFSCRFTKLPKEVKLKGPDIFHSRMVTKIEIFMKCMKSNSLPATSHFCESQPGLMQNYTPCILQGKNLLDGCLHEASLDIYSDEMSCGNSDIQWAHYVHIRRWLSIIPRERFLFLKSEDLFKNFGQVVMDIAKFLDLATFASPDIIKKVERSVKQCFTGAQDYKKDPRLHMRSDTKEILEAFYLPFNQLLDDLLHASK